MLLAYARVARVHLESLIDDEATLPNTLPGKFIFSRYKQRPDPANGEAGNLNGKSSSSTTTIVV
jgi:hypothetical protein